MDSDTKFKNYLYDLGIQIREYALDAKNDRDIAYSDFNAGYLSGFHRVISLMKQQAEAFGISVEELGLSSIDPDEELI